ncbi:S8 family serine peptidase [Pseudoroseomonas globiformis]|uniref:S8 family serine peptidase n=1 Tax=Teichococcus globiformis TaxID=2307229 RepID=A0ABV7G908_9PROT
MRSTRLFPLLLRLLVAGAPALQIFALPGTAIADDGGGNSGGDGGGSGSGGDGGQGFDGLPTTQPGRGLDELFGRGGLFDRIFQGSPPARSPTPPRTAAPATAASGEVIAFGLTQAQLGRLNTSGFGILAQQDMAGAAVMARLRVPQGLGTQAAIARIATLAPGAAVAPNHYYRNQAGADDCTASICASWSQVGWRGAGQCGEELRIGVIDTSPELAHPALRGAQITTRRFVAGEASPSPGSGHGTAIVAILAGASDSPAPGLLPGADILVADPFIRGPGSDERADSFDLVRSLEHLAGSGVQAINLSLAGPENAVLRLSVERVLQQGVALVAAVGNAGPRAQPLYPAAYPGVIGVTAVDAAGQLYRRALRGTQVDFAAPGVRLPTASPPDGLRMQNGTSFATPFITAAISVLLAANPKLGPAEAERLLSNKARDLGKAGRDNSFGWGLFQAMPHCETSAG